MNNQFNNKNARTALKQMKMEIAADYGMDYENAFDIIENARSNGLLFQHFKNLEDKKKMGESLTSMPNKKM